MKRGIKNNEIGLSPGIITSNQQNNPKITKKNLRKFGPGNPSHLFKKSLLTLAITDTAYPFTPLDSIRTHPAKKSGLLVVLELLYNNK